MPADDPVNVLSATASPPDTVSPPVNHMPRFGDIGEVIEEQLANASECKEVTQSADDNSLNRKRDL